VTIRYIQFIAPVDLGPGIGSATHWSADKHHGKTEIVEAGAWLHVFVVERIKIDGPEGPIEQVKRLQRRRIPMTNVAYINDDGVDEKRGKA